MADAAGDTGGSSAMSESFKAARTINLTDRDGSRQAAAAEQLTTTKTVDYPRHRGARSGRASGPGREDASVKAKVYPASAVVVKLPFPFAKRWMTTEAVFDVLLQACQ